MQFRDLQKQYNVLKEEIDREIEEVCASAQYISGSKVTELEEKLAEYVGVKHCITCANGTDALTLALKAWGIGENDAIFVPDFTFFSSGECPAGEGATCIFVDVDRYTYNIDPIKLEEAIQKVNREGKYCAKVVVAVDLFGQTADYDKIRPICDKYNLFLLEDGAQGFGGELHGKKQVLLEISQPQAFSRQSHLVATVMEEPFLRITIVGQNLSGVLQYMVSLETINTIM